MKKTGLYEYVNSFLVDDYSIDADHILGIHKYLLKKRNIK